MYTPVAAEILRRETARAARAEAPRARARGGRRAPVGRRRLAALLRRSADRLAPEV